MINVLFFAQLREQLDCSEIQWTHKDKMTLMSLLHELTEHDPQWYDPLMKGKLLMAVNQNMVSADTQISDGDEVAFFPPVTGG